MQTKPMALVMLMAVVLSVAAYSRAETAAESFTRGRTQVTKGEFEAALQSYAVAARADQGNQEYVQHYALLRRVIDIRNRLETEQDPQRWEHMARGLRAFYASEHIYPELLKLEKEIHTRVGSGDTAAILAETQLAMNQNAEAAATLSALKPDKTTDAVRALLGVALARTGKMDQARQIAQQLSLPADAGPGVMYAAARLHAATGNPSKAVELLKAGFEATLPSALDSFKAHAKVCPEFAAILSTPEFVRVLETESKMPESKCSGGSSCAGCPMRGKCAGSQAKQ